MSDNDLKTLREHNVQVGDVVACWNGIHNGTLFTMDNERDEWCGGRDRWWRVISRANAAPAIDLTENKTAFGLLDDATKAALRSCGECERYFDGHWRKLIVCAYWRDHWIIRAVPKPTRDEMVFFGWDQSFNERRDHDDTHSLTLPTQDGALICGTYIGPDGARVVIAEVGE